MNKENEIAVPWAIKGNVITTFQNDQYGTGDMGPAVIADIVTGNDPSLEPKLIEVLKDYTKDGGECGCAPGMGEEYIYMYHVFNKVGYQMYACRVRPDIPELRDIPTKNIWSNVEFNKWVVDLPATVANLRTRCPSSYVIAAGQNVTFISPQICATMSMFSSTVAGHFDTLETMAWFCSSGIIMQRIDTDNVNILYVIRGKYGFDTTPMKVKRMDSDISLNYNDDLPHERILNFLKEPSNSGILIFHGTPGTGKSSYIRNLIYQLNTQVLLMDKSVFETVGTAEFSRLILDYKNAVVVMEDCESLLTDRESENGALATILNMADGIMGDGLGMKFICTFNADLQHIDPAVLRRGRLFLKYEFKNLCPEKTHALCCKIGVDPLKFSRGAALCDIYNADHDNGNDNKKGVMGFGV